MKNEEAVKLFSEIASRKGKKIIQSTPDTFYYETWYSDEIRFDDNGLCHVRLRDFAIHSGFHNFIMELQSETGFEIIVSDTISLGYCGRILGNVYEGIAFTEGKWGWAPESDEYKMNVLKQIALDLNSRLSYYSIVIEDAKLCVKAINDASKQAIINKEPSFIEDMDRVKEYISEHKEVIIQELKPAALAWKKEQWYKETLTGKVAKKFKDMISPRGENIHLSMNTNTYTILDKFEYKGREYEVWAIYPYSEVGDYDIGPAEYYVKLSNVAICPEFLCAVKEVAEEEGVFIHFQPAIDLNDCLSIAGFSPIDYKGVTNRLQLTDVGEINNYWLKVCKELSAFLEPEFHIFKHCDFDNNFKLSFNNVYGPQQEDIINRSPLFMDKMQKVANYLERL